MNWRRRGWGDSVDRRERRDEEEENRRRSEMVRSLKFTHSCE